jgi:predicted metal-dependent enzyme (double-stranded beta helix superfamily)
MQSREVLGKDGATRAKLNDIKKMVLALAADTALWQGAEFPPPTVEEKQNRFMIDQDEETGLTLYLNVMQPGKKIPPHNHTVWACIAAVEGAEENTIYDRVDDGATPGKAELKVSKVVNLRPGHAIAMMADDIHSVEIQGTDVIRHLHFYGRPLETLDSRLTFDLAHNTCKIMDIGVKTK